MLINKNLFVLLTIVPIIICCSSIENINTSSTELIDNSVELWYKKDFFKDSIYGISLDKWHNENPKKIKNEIIVAVLDTQIDLENENIQNQLWVNKKESPNNGIDDDNNGYIDDINGWNFVGKPNGGFLIYGNFEYTRIIQKWDSVFKNKTTIDIPNHLLNNFNQYISAKKKRDYYLSFYSQYNKSVEYRINIYNTTKDTLKHFFPKEDYELTELDSLYKKYKTNDKSYWERKDDKDEDLGALIDAMMVNYEQNERKLEDLIYSKNQIDSIINQNLNVNFNDRKYIQDNPNALEKGYGNNFINSYKKLQEHSTEVSSIIAGNSKNKKGIKGFHQNIKIMPLVTSISGDEHDKDIAMAIYYAVDNGAKVINMSFGKEFSLKQKWVTDAMKYAEKNNVLLIHSSGNNRINIDKNHFFPNDYEYESEKEISGNFINVGSISKRTDNTMVSPFSNYGKNNVDIFAPGEEIYVALPDNQYKYDSGTSLAAPMVSGTAALIWLYYPDLSVQEVKSIILESGITVDKMVIKPGSKNEMVQFSELCKSSKILNTYHAMKLAHKISERKK